MKSCSRRDCSSENRSDFAADIKVLEICALKNGPIWAKMTFFTHSMKNYDFYAEDFKMTLDVGGVNCKVRLVPFITRLTFGLCLVAFELCGYENG